MGGCCDKAAEGGYYAFRDGVSIGSAERDRLSASLAEAIRERDEKQAALVELIKAAKCMMNAIAMSETCIIRFEAALKEAGVDDGFGVRAQKAAGIDTANTADSFGKKG